MASFMLIVDPDPARRHDVWQAARDRVAIAPGLVEGSIEAGDVAVAWAVAPGAPMDVAPARQESMAIILGEAFADHDRPPLAARELMEIWATPETSFPILDGWHAAVALHPHKGLVVCADLLGVFPIYYWHDDTVLLVATSPELFTAYPGFQAQIDRLGLTGLVLTHSMVSGRTLVKGVRRLTPGHSLCLPPGGVPEEKCVFKPNPTEDLNDVPISEQFEMLYDALSKAIRTQVSSDQNHLLLLSGGLDSRVVAGVMGRHGIMATALSLGHAHEDEVQFARLVAKELGFDHHVHEMGDDTLAESAVLSARWESISNGMSSIEFWAMLNWLQDGPRRFLSGLMLDPLIGGSHLDWAYQRSTRSYDYQNYINRLATFGPGPRLLEALLGPRDGADLVQEVMGKLLEVLTGYGGRIAQNCICFDIHHRQRLHVGSIAWRMGFGSWPVMICLDRRLIDLCLSMPGAVLMHRYAEEQVLLRWCPALAEIPLDRNSPTHNRPLREPMRVELRNRIAHRLGRAGRWIAPRPGSQTTERLRFHRVYDFNGPGWRMVRQQAEPYRELAKQLFDPEVLDRMLPLPDEELRFTNPFTDTAGAKMIIGLMLWLGRSELGQQSLSKGVR